MEDHGSRGRRRRFQLSLGKLMLLMLLLSVLAAVLGGLLQGGLQERKFILLGAAAPLGVMLLLGLSQQIVRRWKRRG